MVVMGREERLVVGEVRELVRRREDVVMGRERWRESWDRRESM